MKPTPLKKEFRYYFGAFVLTSIVVLLYAVVQVLRDGLSFEEALGDLWALPFLVLGLLVVYEAMLLQLIKRQAPKRNEKQFNIHVSSAARITLNLTPEDFKKLRLNEAFQKALVDIYQLFKNNPSDREALTQIPRRFNQDPQTKEVVEVIVAETIHLIEAQSPKEKG